MKEGWEYKKLGECFISINNGANIKQIKGAKGIPITRIETLSNDKFNRGRMGYADILDASPYSSYILNDGDILMSHINSMKYLGRAVQYLKKEDETIIHGMNLLRLVPTKDVLSSFLIYQFFTAFFRNQIVSISHQSVNQASFNTTNLKNLKLIVPPLSEQQSIVDYLDSAFAKIDAMKANAEKALNEAKALFQASLKEMLEPKEGWEEKKLEDIGELKNGMNFKKNESGYIIHILGVGDFGNLFQIDNTDCLQTISLNSNPSKDYILKNEDIVFVRSNGNKNLVGRCVLIHVGDEPCSFSGFCIRFRKSTNEVDACYLTHLLKTEDSRKKLVGNGANISNLNQKVLNEFVVSYPSLQEQQSIVATLDSLKSKVDRLQENYDKISQECDALKQAILRQVFE